MRELNDKIINKWQTSKVKDFYEDNKDELFIGIRHNYINLYYHGASISRIESSRTGLRFKIANKYLNHENESGYQEISLENLKSKYNDIKQNINKYFSSSEKKAQQILVLNNNRNLKSNWYCIDIEYIKKRSSRQEKLFGRFDIIAVTRQKPYRTALIELKYGVGAIDGNSGVSKHAQDYFQFIENNEFELGLKSEICSMINSYRRLVNSVLPEVSLDDFVSEPEIYFIALNNQDDNVLKKMQRFLLDSDVKSSNNNFQKWAKKENISSEKLEKFNPIFLFSDACLSQDNNLDIFDIIDHNKYKKELLLK